MAILGYNVHDTGWDESGFSAGNMYVTKYTLATGSTMSELHAWIRSNGGAAGSLRLVVYGDTAGLPGNRVYYTSPLSTGAGGDIEVIETGISASLPAGDYWLGFHTITAPGSGGAMYAGSGFAYKGLSSGVSNPPPSTFGTPNLSGASRRHCVWAVVTASAAVPSADFVGTPLSGSAPLTVVFTDTST